MDIASQAMPTRKPSGMRLVAWRQNHLRRDPIPPTNQNAHFNLATRHSAYPMRVIKTSCRVRAGFRTSSSRETCFQNHSPEGAASGRISEVVAQTRLASAAELEVTLTHYFSTYNHSIPQRTLGHQTPIQSLQI